MRKIKSIVSVVLVMLIISTNLTAVYAKENDKSIEKVKQMALLLPKEFPSTKDWVNNKITNVIPLYDCNDYVYAYGVDIVNEDTGACAYMIILSADGNPQLLEFHPNMKFPNEGAKGKKVFYNGLMNFYVDDANGLAKNLLTGEYVQKSLIREYVANSDSDLRSVNASSGYRNISGVQDYFWYRSCTPTSLAMAMNYIYGSSIDSGDTLIDGLANYCNTIGSSTLLAYVRDGVVDYLNSKSITPNFCNFYSRTTYGAINFGTTYNSLSAYQVYINSGIPVMVAMSGAQGTSPAYPNGFGDHSVCGTGYYVGSSGEFIIVHTTMQEGDVYVAYSSYALGSFAWFIVY